MSDLASRRADYETAGLDVGGVDGNPLVQWQQWYDQASVAGCVEPNAFVLSTIDDEGWPQSRYLLARGADPRKTNQQGLNAAEFARLAGRERLALRLAQLAR